MAGQLALVTLVIAVLLLPAAPAGAASLAAEAATAAAKPSVPRCPSKSRAVTRRWRGWYGCYRKRARKHWVRPTGCRNGYELRVRKAHGRPRAWRCTPVALPPPAPPTPPPPPPPPPQRSLADWAYSFALADIRDRTTIAGNPESWTISESYVQNCHVNSSGTGQCDIWAKAWREVCNTNVDPYCFDPPEGYELAWFPYNIAAVPTVIGIIPRVYNTPQGEHPHSYICSYWGYAGVPYCA